MSTNCMFPVYSSFCAFFMQILRHEEFSEGCKACCNGPYDGKWSKTMVGYGPEDNHFVMELTYNYGVGSYKLGNDFQCIHIDHPDAYNRILSGVWPTLPSSDESKVEVEMPGGYKFRIYNREPDGDPVKMVVLSCSDLKRSIRMSFWHFLLIVMTEYWSRKCGMSLLSSTSTDAVFSFGSGQCSLKLVAVTVPIDHASAFGRIAFACPQEQLFGLQQLMDAEKETILKRLVSLDTPGKATVEVIILADPDGHEICFVGGEAFGKLSQVDPNAEQLLTKAMLSDRSDDWFEKHGGKAIQ
ncbi:Gem nuclear organelle associated protein 4 [Paragonimus heterotremus]|uniref:Gem nuclear organelle associated protein 4 n=1 Tax=Paragonimus heterotremus TaxID=100268 RepID=A0A8J4TKF5_9TREM|nr:Gem nuclear organelle associated protein 4 [Paragonimus heterotremus]